MARTPARRVRRLGTLIAAIGSIAVLRALAFRRNDRLHPLEDNGRAP